MRSTTPLWQIWSGLICLICLWQCSSPKNSSKNTEGNAVHPNFPYTLDTPDDEYVLPDILNEISGITYIREGLLACVQDELGIVYIYDAKARKITHEYLFGKEGDYEGIAKVDTVLYIARSDGKLFRLRGFKSKKLKVAEFNTALSKKNDIEGLCYDANNHRLLLACKGKPHLKKKKYKHSRAIYAFDLHTHQLEKEPFAIIDIEEIQKMTGNKKDKFAPSGIVLHPQTQEIYLLSHQGKKIVILSPDGKQIKGIIPIHPEKIRQPEGICFSPNLTLYLSTEASFSQPEIQRFENKLRPNSKEK
ncbi:SdiA-regulated domain-containing protein [Rapidithrix thailandica]|uniref:SdiA-regulated domain-containing protein n=1 Tax=Rapidithrix thailandica TaxID=413964 RepID=A0AAW9RYY2_9BACT